MKKNESRTEKQLRLYKDIERAFKHPRIFFGVMHIKQLDRALSRKFVAKRRDDGVADGTIRRELAYLKAALSEVHKEGWIESVPPLELPPPGAPRDRMASKEEIRRFFDAADEERVIVFAMLALHTLSRPQAIFELTWDRVDFIHNRVEFNVPGTVNGRKRRVNIEMTDTLRKCLEEAKSRSDCAYVLSYKGERLLSIKRSFKATVKKAGLEKFTPYIFRHTGISQLVMAGADIEEVARIARDDPATIRKHYLKLSPDYVHKAVKALDGLYGDLI